MLPGGSILYVGEEGSPNPPTHLTILAFILRSFCNLCTCHNDKHQNIYYECQDTNANY